MNYIISTSIVPRESYILGDGVRIQPVVPQEQMYDYSIPHHYQSVIALTISEEKILPEAYNVARNLAVFHSFMADDEEVFQYAVEKGIKQSFPDSELEFIADCPRGADFGHFPLSIPRLTKDDEQIPSNYEEATGLKHPYPWEDSFCQVNYGDLFKKFCEFETSTDDTAVQLHGQIYSYVFIRSIWDISNVGLLYKNENMSAMFHVAILESIVGEPSFCETNLNCPKCLRKINRHYTESWQQHLTDELNTLEVGWGNTYIDPIMRSRSRRHLFAHGAAYSDLTQELRKIYDKPTYYGKSITEEDLKKENEVVNEENDLNILERTVRKLLTTRFFNRCGFNIVFGLRRSWPTQ